MAIINIKNLNFRYHGSDYYALKNINLEIHRGDFIVVCGESGCGKSTLLRLLKPQISPQGIKEGQIYYNNQLLETLPDRITVCDLGFVMQNPEDQIITDKVWHELSFGLESLGEKSDTIRRKVAEISGYFGMNDWYRKATDELSGGQKQLLNLASIMVMQPSVLILDEPTSQLDPIVASEFISTLKKLNQEFGITVIIVEHRLEEVFPISDKVVLMNNSGILLYDEPKKIGSLLTKIDPNHKMQLGLPTAIRVFQELLGVGDSPLTVRDGREYIEQNFSNEIRNIVVKKEVTCISNREKVIEIKEAFFRYGRNLPDILDDLTLDIYSNEFLCILGANGSGKTTLLGVIAGIHRIYRGKIYIFNKNIKDYDGVSLYRNNISYLPQNPELLFVKNKLIEDLKEAAKLSRLSKEEESQKIIEICNELDISQLLEKHPYDLSGGEQQKAALAKLLLLDPRLILLDEPTKGLDASSKRTLADIIKGLKKKGKTIIMVTHDVEFAAEYSDRCGMYFDGKIVSLDEPKVFFSENNFYTTSASRMSRGYYDKSITAKQIIDLCKLNGKVKSEGDDYGKDD